MALFDLRLRKHVASAIASAIAAGALAITFAGKSCAGPDDGPVAVARVFWAATQERDVDTVWTLLAPAIKAELTAYAQTATELDGGRKRYLGKEMLRLDEAKNGAQGFRLAKQSATTATVAVTTGTDHEWIELVYVDSAWYVAAQ